MRASRVGSVALALATLAPMAARAEVRHLSVEDAVKLALAQNARLGAAHERLAGGEDQARSLRGHALPLVALSEELQVYNEPFKIAFGPMQFQARDQVTNTFVAALSQPLVGLGHLIEDYRGVLANVDASKAQLQAAESTVREAVRSAFLAVYEAKALEEIARASGAELGEQVNLAEARLKAGVITQADVLRVQVAAANVRQQEIFAHTQGIVARAQLLSALGLRPDDNEVVLDEPKELLAEAAQALPSAQAASESATKSRPELLQSRLLLTAAEHTHRARLLSLLPEVDAEAAYVRIDGQVFAPQNSAYVGVKANWPIWQWGATWYAAQAAKHNEEAARLDLLEQQRTVATEVTTNLEQSQAAATAVEVARTSIASAEEAYRVMQALVKAGTATTTDLLDAQSSLTGARLTLARAQYQQARARVTLARVMGK